MQAVTGVKLEQASKVKSWTPTRLTNGEGCTGREETRRGSASSSVTNRHLYRSTGVVSTACREGDLQRVGEARVWRRSRPERRQKGRRPDWESERAARPVRPGNAGGGKGLTSGVLVKEGCDG